MEKLFIQNRKGQKVSVIVEQNDGQKGLAFVMHGLSGNKDQPHIKMFADAFLQRDYTAIRFDTTNTFGESEGNYEDATVTNYYEDLEDVVAWAKTQDWYQEPFVLAGHSLGGISIALYAEKYPKRVLAIAPISPVVSGQLTFEASERFYPGEMAKWKESGWQEKQSGSNPGVIKRLPWSHMEDRLTYDLLPEAHKLTMPVLLIVGEEDIVTPPDQVELLYKVIPDRKEMHIIKGAPHTFRDPAHLSEITTIFLNWIDTLNL